MTQSPLEVYPTAETAEGYTQVHPHPKLRSWVGGPGTGKTRHLIDAFEREVNAGVPISDIRYTTFTTAQRDDVVARLRQHFPRKTTVLRKIVKTLHGAALESVNMTPSNVRGVMKIIDETKNPDVYKEFCATEGLVFTGLKRGQDLDDETVTPTDPPLGNVLIAVSGFIRQHYGWAPADWGRAANALGLYRIRLLPDPEGSIQRWWDWKAAHSYCEHDDYVHTAIRIGAPAPGRVIIVDEFQDLSPVQYELFRMWIDDPGVERIYIGGDPNQAIYQFRGADPRFLEEAHCQAHGGRPPTTRPASHRCPRNIVDMADLVLDGRSHMEPSKDGGIARWLRARDESELARSIEILHTRYGAVMVVCRFTHFMREVSKALQVAGVPHSSLTGRLPIWGGAKIPDSRSPRDKNGKPMRVDVSMSGVLQALRIVDRYAAGNDLGFIPVDAARDLIYLLPISDLKVSRALSAIKDRKLVNYTVDDLMDLFDRPTSALDIAEHLMVTPKRRDALARALTRGGSILPKDVVVDTIHASKGLEAPAVLVHTGYSEKRRDECYQDPDKMAAERRIYYVALTRASEAVYLFTGGAYVTSPVIDGIQGINLGDWDGPVLGRHDPCNPTIPPPSPRSLPVPHHEPPGPRPQPPAATHLHVQEYCSQYVLCHHS